MHINYLEKHLDNYQNSKNFIKIQTIGYHPNISLPSPKKNLSSIHSQKEYEKQGIVEYAKAKKYLSYITDPLWRDICTDFLHMMGPASLLKIWGSELGELFLQAEEIAITCKNEKVTSFVQQYDFVILGSLQKYFPALKKLKIITLEK